MPIVHRYTLCLYTYNGDVGLCDVFFDVRVRFLRLWSEEKLFACAAAKELYTLVASFSCHNTLKTALKLRFARKLHLHKSLPTDKQPTSCESIVTHPSKSPEKSRYFVTTLRVTFVPSCIMFTVCTISNSLQAVCFPVYLSC